MNRKERRLALATALQSAARDITVVDDIKVGIVIVFICSAAKDCSCSYLEFSNHLSLG